MKESFVFYASFLEAIEQLDDKNQLKIYKSITNFALKNEEPEKLTGICKAIFALIKPQILANNKRYEDGKKGGRPPKIKTSGFENKKTSGYSQKKPNVNVNVNVNENVNENAEVFEKEKKTDPFINPIKTFFVEEYKKEMGNIPRLSSFECNRLLELSANNPDIKELIPEAVRRLKRIDFGDIQFTPSASWLLKGNNFERIMNGEFEPKKTDYERLKEKFCGG